MSFIFQNFNKSLKNPENTYLAIALLFGMLFVFLNPPCGTPDEPSHLLRGFRVAQGHFFSAANVKVPPMDNYCGLCDLAGVNNLPQRMGKDVLNFIKEPFGAEREYEFTPAYPPVPYLPAAATFFLLSCFKFSLAVYIYVGRIATLLVSLFITWYAIKIIPSGKWIMVVLALMPMRLYQAASVSADSVTTALVSLWLALILSMAVGKESAALSKKLPILLLISLLLLFSKQMYLFLLILLFAIPLDIRSHRVKIIAVISLLSCLALFKIWGMASAYSFNTADSTVKDASAAKNESLVMSEMTSGQDFLQKVDPKLQAALLFHDPAKAVKVLFNGYRLLGQDIFRGTIGDLGWRNVSLPKYSIQISALLLGFVLLFNATDRFGLRFRIAALAATFLMLLLIPLGLYLSWTPVGADYFLGVSGRYFIPVMPVFFLAIALPFGESSQFRWTPAIVAFVSAIVLASSLYSIWKAYYSKPAPALVLRLLAQSSSTGTALLSTGTANGVLRPQRRYNLIQSDAPLQYEFSMPDEKHMMTVLNINSPEKINFRIYSADLLTIDGKYLKAWPLCQIQLSRLSADGKVAFVAPKKMGDLVLDKTNSSILFIETTGAFSR